MIGRFERVELREVWKNEAKDFTTWLFDNLETLSEELDLQLNPIDKEKRIGPFSMDITAEDDSGRKVVIENQLEKTDHDHLGKILTYCTNFNAEIAIWISSNPRTEHEKAIEWLNENATSVAFYLVKIEAFRIDDSNPAPKFTVVNGPTETAKMINTETKGDAERQKLRYAFFQGLLDKSNSKTTLHSNNSPNKSGNWITAGSGISGIGWTYYINQEHGAINIYIDRGKDSKSENESIFDQLHSNKTDIETKFGKELLWDRMDGSRACKIGKKFESSGLRDSTKWDVLQGEMVDGMVLLAECITPYLKRLNT